VRARGAQSYGAARQSRQRGKIAVMLSYSSQHGQSSSAALGRADRGCRNLAAAAGPVVWGLGSEENRACKAF